MNDFAELEMELRRLRPARPSADLRARIEHSLVGPVISGSRWREITACDPKPATWKLAAFFKSLALPVSLAAVLLLLARIDQKPAEENQRQIASARPRFPESIPVATDYQPSGLTQVVYDQRNEGLLYPTGSREPVRLVRTARRETLRWQDQRTGSSIRVSYPVEEVTLMPVSFQ